MQNMTSNFEIKDLSLSGVKLISSFYLEDNRGYFLKDLEQDVFRSWGLDAEIYESFESFSKKDVIRGMHFQLQNPQIKIVRAIKGVVHDVVLDIRKDSKTFGKYLDIILSDENHNSLWIPDGFAHGFEVISDDAIMSYKCIGKYLKGYDTGICWNDKDIAINWHSKQPIVSERDASLMCFKEFVNKYGGI